MASNLTSHLTHVDLSDIRDAVPTLDLFAIRSLRRAGFQIIRQEPEQGTNSQAGQSSQETAAQRASAA